MWIQTSILKQLVYKLQPGQPVNVPSKFNYTAWVGQIKKTYPNFSSVWKKISINRFIMKRWI
jgi:hypothetical protein